MFVGAIGQFDGAVYGIAWSRPAERARGAVPPVQRVEAADSGSPGEQAWVEALAAMVRGGGLVVLDREAGSWQVFVEDDSPGLRRRLDRVYRGDEADVTRRRRDGEDAWGRASRWPGDRSAGSVTDGDAGHSAGRVGGSHGRRRLDFGRIVRVLEGVLDRHVRAADGRIGPAVMGRLREAVGRLQRGLREGGDGSADAAGVVDRIGRAFAAELGRIAAEGRAGGDVGGGDGAAEASGSVAALGDGLVDGPAASGEPALSEAEVLETLRQVFAAEVEQLRRALDSGEVRPVENGGVIRHRGRSAGDATGSDRWSAGVDGSSIGVGMAGLIVDAVA